MIDKNKQQTQIIDYPDEILLDQGATEIKNLLKVTDCSYEFEMKEIDFENMHNKIMAQVEKTEIKKQSALTKVWSDKVARANIKQKIYRSSMILGFCLFSYYSFPKITKVMHMPWTASGAVLADAEQDPLVITALSSYRRDHDFFVDVASASLDHLSREQFARLMKTNRKTR